MTLTKDDISKAAYLNMIGSQHDLAKRSDAKRIVEDVFETIKQTLERGEKVKLHGFGNFTPRDKKARPGRNSKTGEAIVIEARRVVSFKASPVLKNKINLSKPAEPAKG